MDLQGSLEKVKGWPTSTKSYISELQLEMRRVTWPNKKQVQATTAVVIITVFAFAAYFALVDSLLNRTVMKIYSVLTK